MKKAKTRHGTTRMQQRGRSALDVRVIQKYGECQRGGGIRLLSRRRATRAIARLRAWLKRWQNSPQFFRRAARVRQIVASLEKTTNWMTVSAPVATGELLITVYPADRARQRKFMRGACRAV